MSYVVGVAAFFVTSLGVSLIVEPFVLEAVGRAGVRVRRRWTTLRRRSVVESQWPGVLTLAAGALRAGLNLEEAVEVLLSETPEPSRTCLRERLGEGGRWLPLPVKIERLFSDSSLALARATLLLSHESGGRAAALLETCARLLRQKFEMREKIKTLTAEGRLSAWIVGLSPLALMAAFEAVSPDFLAPLFSTRAGLSLLLLATILSAAGLYFVHRVAAIEP